MAMNVNNNPNMRMNFENNMPKKLNNRNSKMNYENDVIAMNIATPEKTAKLAEKYTQYSYIDIEKLLLDNNGSVSKTVNVLKNGRSSSNGGTRKTRRRSRKMMK